MNKFLICGLISFLLAACNNNKEGGSSIKKTTSIEKSSKIDSTYKEFKSPTVAKYERYYDSLSKTPNFKPDTIPTFGSTNKNKGSVFISFGSTSKAKDSMMTSFGSRSERSDPKSSGASDYQLQRAENYLANHSDNSDDYALIKSGVDWIFCCGGNNPPTRLSGYFYPVKYFGYSLIRGWYSARTCGNLAVVHAMFGMRGDALTWLDAAQSHNGEVIAAFERNPDYALNYAIAGHAKDAFIELGIPYLDEGKSGVQVLKNMAENWHPDPIPPDERNSGGNRPNNVAERGTRN